MADRLAMWELMSTFGGMTFEAKGNQIVFKNPFVTSGDEPAAEQPDEVLVEVRPVMGNEGEVFPGELVAELVVGLLSELTKPDVPGIREVRYLTDDRDLERGQNELVLSMGGNGDWYVAVAPEGEGILGRAVRICTSGGASSAAPGLGRSIAAAFRAIANAAPREGITHVRRE